MKTPTRFIASLTNVQRAELNEVMKSHPNARTRMRAHAILLSARGYAVDRIADIYEVDRDSVSTWLDRWERQGVAGLEEQPRHGRPPALSASEARRAVEIVRREPRNVRQGLDQIEAQLGKRISRDTLKRVLKKTA